MDKSEITDILEEIAILLELKGENPFKARAYTTAARTLDSFEGDIAQVVAVMGVMVALGMVADWVIFARLERGIYARFGLTR